MARSSTPLRLAVGTVVAMCVFSLGAMTANGLWSASATVAGTSLQSGTVTSQAQPTCTNAGGTLGLLGSAVLTWSHVDTRYEYSWRLVRVSNGNVASSGVISPTGAVGSTVTLTITASLFALGLPNIVFDVVVTSRLKGAPAWTAPTSTTTSVRTVSLVVGLSMRCN